MASYRIVAINKFNFEQWETWIRRFKCFKIASGLTIANQRWMRRKSALLIISLGDNQICYSLSRYRRKIREKNMTKFSSASQGHFDKSRNTICKRAKFIPTECSRKGRLHV